MYKYVTLTNVCWLKIQVGSLTKYNGSIEEYMQVARVGSALPLATTLSFIGIG